MDLAMLWFALVVLCWVLFAVLEGFDFGVGMLAGLLGRDEHERGAAVRTVGPVWDGNEVWLVAAIGVTFAAFPAWYAALLSGLYLPVVVVLLALAARGVALEFRGKVDTAAWRRRCDLVLGVSSLVSAAGFGAVVALATTGLALGPDAAVAGSGLTRSLAPLATWPALAGALAGVLAALLQGAAFLGLRTTGPVRVRARWVAVTTAGLVAVGAAVTAGTTTPAAAPVAVLAVGAGLAAARRREALAFAAASLAVLGGVVAAFTAHLPVVLRSTLDPAWSLTVAGAAASPVALEVITIGGIVILPGVLAYQAFSYWVFRRRVASGREVTA
ncbi:cytochrome d ubiquinol oxidase subunit II [Actinomycetospora sp. TBRC 11914]|uniref:cytochrome d ubiquinol oxidase subunit II n=1 Tax=Actinomycetospora sp. TBRC 11914 TaxID=2729387 RepID=UPI00145F3D9A|nr:cytochrome d ubiquinol oxidase subunit II [Actinomycetospora sp. TBRC 11914]NMO91253.1 cytochrome d ubiquinol oxidase subunit II [Actinomycetospora sp. TBRC 11914]